ncbi:MAG: DUF2480 family protein [Bacteroidetes bacterium]|nr:DUF2480 family protein [Bacteroidota bacterium]MDA1269546.1 DUF2480 family protein [Bacteroidota bacterium]
MSELINRVAASSIVSLNMEEFYPQEERMVFDLADYLEQGLVLREKEFRAALKAMEWNQFEGKWVAVTCSADAIVPTWAFMLVCTYLEGKARGYCIGDLVVLELVIVEETLSKLPLESFRDRSVIIKGCSKVAIPLFAYGRLVAMLQREAKSLLFGEPCSTVPLYKKAKT